MRIREYLSTGLGLFAGIAVALGSAADITGGARVDLQYDKPLSLRSYGGPDVALIVRGREHSTVKFTLIDNEHTVLTVDPVWVPGQKSRVVESPTVRSDTLTLDMGSGIPVTNPRGEAHLLYECASLKVYWFDVIDTVQNSCALLIVSATPQKR